MAHSMDAADSRSASVATHALVEESGGETRYVPPIEQEAEESRDGADKTHTFADEDTRILEPEKLGARPGRPKESTFRKPMFGFAMLVVSLVAGAVFFITHSVPSSTSDGQAGALLNTCHDDQFAFAFSYPSSWGRAPCTKRRAVDFSEARCRQAKWPVRVDVFADRNVEHGLTGLTTGFEPPPGAYAPPPPPPPDPAASAVGGAIVGGLIGGLLTGHASGAAAGAIAGGATGAIVGAQAASRPGYYLAQGNCYYRYPSGQYVQADPRACY